jgi:lipid A 3-O-deacylase
MSKQAKTLHSILRSALGAAVLLVASGGAAHAAADSILPSLKPSSLFAQVGAGDNNTQSYLAGATWEWNWTKQTKWGDITGFQEASFGRWVVRDAPDSGSAWATQLGITPVFRLRPASWGGEWFTELGIGANVILPLYRSKHKRFSTEFNFGDHVAVGRWFGDRSQHELALRFEHFSNAGIDEPNPGENFVQLRYAHRL